MKPHSIVIIISLLISVLSLATAFLLAGYVEILIVLPALALFCFLIARYCNSLAISFLLIAFIAMAVVGVILEQSTILITISSTAAIASWGLLLFMHKGAENKILARDHLRSVGAAMLASLLLVSISTLLSFSSPFWIESVFIFVAFAGLLGGFGWWKNL